MSNTDIWVRWVKHSRDSDHWRHSRSFTSMWSRHSHIHMLQTPPSSPQGRLLIK